MFFPGDFKSSPYLHISWNVIYLVMWTPHENFKNIADIQKHYEVSTLYQLFIENALGFYLKYGYEICNQLFSNIFKFSR